MGHNQCAQEKIDISKINQASQSIKFLTAFLKSAVDRISIDLCLNFPNQFFSNSEKYKQNLESLLAGTIYYNTNHIL